LEFFLKFFNFLKIFYEIIFSCENLKMQKPFKYPIFAKKS